MAIIEAVNLSKYYEPPREGIFGWRQILKEIRGPQQTLLALKNVNLKIEKGELFGLLGPNGAGKTTFCKIMNALVIPTEGQILINGMDSIKHHGLITPRMCTIFAGDLDIWNVFTRRLTVERNMEFMAKLWDIPEEEIHERVDYAIEVLELESKRKDWYQKLSTGLKQRVYLGLSFVVQPEIVVLDEPTIHLDVPSKRMIHTIIREQLCRTLGCTVVLTTHNMDEAEKLCDRVAILDRGVVRVVDRPENIRGFSKVLHVLEVKLKDFDSSLFEKLDKLSCIEKAQLVEAPIPLLRLNFKEKAAAPQIIDCLMKNATVVDLRLTEPAFEDIFLSVLKGDDQ
jgi:ABC-2 type transport system ATP-binding protein